VDTKKKELVGNFKTPGRVWSQQAVAVNDHDFRSQGLGMASPYGIFDLCSVPRYSREVFPRLFSWKAREVGSCPVEDLSDYGVPWVRTIG
jgi:hypothetical protein